MSIEFVTIADVRDFMVVTGEASTGKYSDHLISSNIRTASARAQRDTHRIFLKTDDVERTYSSEGRAIVEISDCRGASSVLISGGTRTLDSDAWLLRDANHPDIFTAIQLRAIGGLDYRAYSDWFDTNKDRNGYWRDGRLPNDLVLIQDEGWDPYPDDLLHAVKALAAWLTRRPDSLLANVQVSNEGTIFDYSAMPPEYTGFVESWKRGPILTTVNG